MLKKIRLWIKGWIVHFYKEVLHATPLGYHEDLSDIGVM